MNAVPHNPRPFYIRNATTHTNLPYHYRTREEALADRATIAREFPDSIYIVKEG